MLKKMLRDLLGAAGSKGRMHIQSGRKSTLDICGQVYTGKDIHIVNGQVVVDGKVQNEDLSARIVEIRVIEGEIGNLATTASVTCGAVKGDVDAGGSVDCKDVGGSVQANGKVTCKDVGASVKAGGSVECGKVSGNIDAGGSVRHG